MDPNEDGGLLAPADGEIGDLCDVGGCGAHGRFWVGDRRVCLEHFDAYLRDEFDLEEYFRIKDEKARAAAEEATREDAWWEAWNGNDPDE